MTPGRTRPICSLFVVHAAPQASAQPAAPPTPEEEPALDLRELAVSERRTRRVVSMASYGEVDALRLQQEFGITQGAANAMLSRLFRSGHLKRVEIGRYVADRSKR